MSSFTRPLKYTFIDKYRNGRKLYKIDEEFTYLVGSFKNPILEINVPIGFITDLASIPIYLQWLFKPDGKWVKAAVIHDFLYSKENQFILSNIIKDSIFLEGMIILNVPSYIAYLFFIVVRIAVELRYEK